MMLRADQLEADMVVRTERGGLPLVLARVIPPSECDPGGHPDCYLLVTEEPCHAQRWAKADELFNVDEPVDYKGAE